MKVVVVGLGNLLLGDEGVGVHAARALLQEGGTDGALVLEVGTAVLDALSELEKAHLIIVLDAVEAGHKPGTIYRMPLEAFERPRRIASMHGFDLSRVLALAQRESQPEVIVIGVEPARIHWSMELSPEVAKALPFLLDAVRKEIDRSRG